MLFTCIQCCSPACCVTTSNAVPSLCLREPDDGSAQELKAFHSKAEANAVEALSGARLRGESGAYLDMANASIQGALMHVPY